MASDPFVVPKAPAQASPQRFSSERRRALRQLKIFLQLGWILPLIAFFLAATYLYREAFADAERAINHGSRVAQEQALKLFETNAMVLQRMLDMRAEVASPAPAMENGTRRCRCVLAYLNVPLEALARSRVLDPMLSVDFRRRPALLDFDDDRTFADDGWIRLDCSRHSS